MKKKQHIVSRIAIWVWYTVGFALIVVRPLWGLLWASGGVVMMVNCIYFDFGSGPTARSVSPEEGWYDDDRR